MLYEQFVYISSAARMYANRTGDDRAPTTASSALIDQQLYRNHV